MSGGERWAHTGDVSITESDAFPLQNTCGNYLIISTHIFFNTDLGGCHNNGGCEFMCVETVMSYYCTCKPGYQLTSDLHSCQDVDECEQNNPCPTYCENSPGSFE